MALSTTLLAELRRAPVVEFMARPMWLGWGGGRRPRGSQLCSRELVGRVHLPALLPLVRAALVHRRAQGFRHQQHQQAHPGTQLSIPLEMDSLVFGLSFA
jgi:hypothetical protein